MALCLDTPQHVESEEIDEESQQQGSSRNSKSFRFRTAAIVFLALFTFGCSAVKAGMVCYEINSFVHQREINLPVSDCHALIRWCSSLNTAKMFCSPHRENISSVCTMAVPYCTGFYLL